MDLLLGMVERSGAEATWRCGGEAGDFKYPNTQLTGEIRDQRHLIKYYSKAKSMLSSKEAKQRMLSECSL